MGTWVERTRVAVAGPRLAECGANRAGSPSTSRPCSHTFAQINRECWTRSGGERGRQSAGSTPQPHIHIDKPDEWWGAKQTSQPKAPAWENKALNL